MVDSEQVERMLEQMQDFTPTIPDEVADTYMHRAGLACPDPRVRRLVAAAAQKFVCDVASDALQYCKVRQAQNKSKGKDKRLVLTSEDLSAALASHGVSVRKPEYLADTLSGGVDLATRTKKK